MNTSLVIVEVRTTRRNDWCWAVLGVAGALLCGWQAILATDMLPADVTGVKVEGYVLIFLDTFGATGVRIASGLMALLCGSHGAGALWRLQTGRRTLSADAGGISFHPSFYPTQLSWSKVASVTLQGRRPARINIRLKKRFWALTSPVTSRNVEFNLIAIGSTYRLAQLNVRQMKRWLKAGQCRIPPDADATAPNPAVQGLI